MARKVSDTMLTFEVDDSLDGSIEAQKMSVFVEERWSDFSTCSGNTTNNYKYGYLQIYISNQLCVS